MHQYNDNELLYLIYENENDALGILFKKYDPLIKKKLYDFRIKREYYDDFHQEGMIALFIAIKKYNPFLEKSFNKFFELILVRRIKTILNQNKNHFTKEILGDVDELMDITYGLTGYEDPVLASVDKSNNLSLKDEIIPNMFSNWEAKVFSMRYLDGYPIKEIASSTGEDVKKVYNSLYQIKKKLKNRITK